MLRHVVAVLILQLDQSAVLLLVRIDATQRPNNDAVECALEDFRVDDGACKRVCENVSSHENFLMRLTSWQQSNILSWNAIPSGDAIARSCQRVFNLLTQFQMIRVSDEVAEVEEDFLVVLEGLDEAEVVLREVNPVMIGR